MPTRTPVTGPSSPSPRISSGERRKRSSRRCDFAARLSLRVVPEDLDVPSTRGVLWFADALELAWIDDHVDALELAQFAQLRRGARRLHGAPAREDMKLAHPGALHRLQCVHRKVGGGEVIGGARQDAHRVHRHVADADDRRRVRREIELPRDEVGMTVVPAHELGGGVAARKVFAGNAQVTIGLRAHGVDHRFVMTAQLRGRDVVAHVHVAEETEPRLRRDPFEHPGHRLDLRVIGGHAAAHQAKRRRQPVEHVDVKSGLQQRSAA